MNLLFLILTLFLPLPGGLLQSQMDPTMAWNDLCIRIRDGLISKKEAIQNLRDLEELLREDDGRQGERKHRAGLCFPLRGYSFHSVGGVRGSGYQAEGYDFFDGNRHRGHPGHDIFIHDRNQDGLDDRTQRPVEVIPAFPGIVVAISLGWEPSSSIRGGNYIWIYDPTRRLYFYYAHLNQVFVKIGQTVSWAESLGTVGRTGVNAHPRRSPTHLHFTLHQSQAGNLTPVNPYDDLVKANLP